MILLASELTLSVWGQAGVAGLIFVGAMFVLRWTDKHQRVWLDTANAHIGSLEDDMAKLKAQHALCEWRSEVLLGVMRRAGLDIPAAYWTPPAAGMGDDERSGY